MNESEFGLNIQSILEDNKQAIVKGAIEQIKSSISSQVAYGANTEINKSINEFINAEILPEVNNYLQEHKQELVDEYTKVISEALGMVGSHMLKKAEANMAYSYKADKIVKELFG